MTTYQLVPPLSDTDYAALREDIRAHGVLVPVVQDEDGNTLDGFHRLRVVAELQAEGVAVPAPRVDVRPGLSEGDKIMLAVGLNLHRRQLTDAQRTLVGQRLVAALSEAKHERSRSNLVQFRPKGTSVPVGEEDRPPIPTGKTRDAVAEIVGLGAGRTFERNEQAIQAVQAAARVSTPRGIEARDLLASVESGAADMRDVRRLAARLHPRVRQGQEAGPQGRTQYISVGMTRREYQTLMDWAWQRRDHEALLGLHDASVRVVMDMVLAREVAGMLHDDNLPGLVGVIEAAMENPPQLQDLSNEEQAAVRVMRRVTDGEVVIDMVHGTPNPRPTKTWHWGDGGKIVEGGDA